MCVIFIGCNWANSARDWGFYCLFGICIYIFSFFMNSGSWVYSTIWRNTAVVLLCHGILVPNSMRHVLLLPLCKYVKLFGVISQCKQAAGLFPSIHHIVLEICSHKQWSWSSQFLQPHLIFGTERGNSKMQLTSTLYNFWVFSCQCHSCHWQRVPVVWSKALFHLLRKDFVFC